MIMNREQLKQMGRFSTLLSSQSKNCFKVGFISKRLVLGVMIMIICNVLCTSMKEDIQVSVCGDGHKDIIEACDDGNKENGDGCSSDCTHIEVGWICVDTSDGFSNCSKFKSMNDKLLHRNLSNVSEDQTYVRSFVFGIVGIGALFNMISCIFSEASYQSIFSSFNFLQLVLLIPLTGVYLPNKPVVFITSVKPSLLTFFSISCDDLSIIKSTFDECYYSQTNSGLYAIGLEQGSTIMNMHIVLLCFFILVFIHLFTLPFYLCARKKADESKCSNFITKFFKLFTFSVYIRLLLEVSLLLLLATFSEINEGKLSSNRYIRSFSFAVAILLFLVTLSIIYFIHWIIYGREESMEDSVFEDFYRGIKPFMFSRSFNLQFILRRILFACLFTFLYSQSMTIKFSVLIGIQGIYVIGLIIVRPFDVIKDNVLEIFNEVGYFILCAWIAYFNTSSRWSTITGWVYWGILIGVISGFLIISFVFMIIAIVKREKSEPKVGISNQTIHPIEKEKSRSVHIVSLEEIESKDSARFKNTEREEIKDNSQHEPESYFDYARKRLYGNAINDRPSSEPYYKKYPHQREIESRTGLSRDKFKN